jgi:tetratricopeptide (TPR) repeat protein
MTELLNFSIDTENAQTNYNLARWYENQGHFAPAHTYYLRCAERSVDDLLAYRALLRSSFCYKAQSSRDGTEKIALENALNLLPERPEAYYFLSLLYEKKKDWQNSYTYANLGLSCYKQTVAPIADISEYIGKYLLIFQKAIAAWWWGKGMESRKLLHSLVDEHWNIMDEGHKKAVEDNITRLGSGPESQAFIPYIKENHSKLRYQFPGSITIEQNHSQVLQDMFILCMTNGKRNGSFLEIGAADPFKGNNSALLEKSFGWKGVSLEYDQKFIENYRNNRSAKLLHQNALETNYEQLLKENFEGNVIDYLQLDIEPARNTYECMLKIPFNEYKFAVITYEHDYYVDVTRSYREKSREFLKSQGYVLVVNDISPDGVSNFEDWWVHPDLVSPEILNKMQSIRDGIHDVREYMFSDTQKQEPELQVSDFFMISNNSKQTCWAVDNFYENPDEVRKFASEQSYLEGGFGRGFIGRRTEQQFLFPGLKERFEEIMGKKITKWEEHGMNGRFQVAWAGEPLVYHCDSQKWAGMLYLTPDAPYSCGTTLYAHKETRARTYYDEGWDVAWKDIPGDPHLDGTPWEPVDVLGNVYNRLVIFDASCIHSASQYFGTVIENARLWQMFFFD